MNGPVSRMPVAMVVLLAAAAALGAQEVFRQTGRLDEGDATLTDGRYVDWHRFSLAAGTRYLFSVEGDSLDPAVIVRFSDGTTLANDDLDGWDAGVVFNSTRAEGVEIGATSSSEAETGDYVVVVRRLGAARAVQSGQTVNGALAAPAGEKIHLDSYVLNGTKGDRVRIRLDSTAFDPRLRLQTRTGYIDENDDVAEGNGSALSYLFLDQGQLEIQVRGSEADDTGAYQLVVDRRPAARTLESGRALTGRLSNDTEEFVLEGKRGQGWVIEATAEDFDTVLTVADRQGRKARNDDHGGETDSLINYYFGSDGAAMVSVERLESGESAPFRVIATPSTQRADAYVRPSAGLEDGVSYRGYLDVGADRDGDKYAHRFTFQGEQNELVRLELRSEDFDSYLEVKGPDGAEFSDDDGGGNYDALLQVVCTDPGLYTVSVTSATDWSVGFYELSFSRGGQVAPTLDQEGALELRDERDPSGRHFDVYTLMLEGGESITVDMISEDFDAFLYVWSPDGEDIQNDDDSGGDTSARVQIDDAASGTWTIYATSSSSGETGSYHVRASTY